LLLNKQSAILSKLDNVWTKLVSIGASVYPNPSALNFLTNTSISKINNSDYQLQLPLSSWKHVIILDKKLKEHYSIRMELVSLKYL